MLEYSDDPLKRLCTIPYKDFDVILIFKTWVETHYLQLCSKDYKKKLNWYHNGYVGLYSILPVVMYSHLYYCNTSCHNKPSLAQARHMSHILKHSQFNLESNLTMDLQYCYMSNMNSQVEPAYNKCPKYSNHEGDAPAFT